MSIIEIAIRIVAAMGIDKDAPTPHDYGKIVANLIMVKNNCPTTLWNEQLWDFIAMPDEKLPEQYAFLAKTAHYKTLFDTLDALYELSRRTELRAA